MTRQLWLHYALNWKLDTIAGGIPVDPRLIDAWQQANWRKQAKLLPDDPKDATEAAARTKELVPVAEGEAGWTTFPRTRDGRLAIEGRQVKAAIKEASNILRPMLPRTEKGSAIPWRARVAERIFVVEKLLPFVPEKTEPDDMLERPIHVMTAQGPRDALKRTDVLIDVEILATVRVLNDGMVTPDVLKTILDYAVVNGLGADRSQGMGTGDYVLRPI